MPKDPGAVPSITAGVRYTSDDGRFDVNLVADGINGGQWGYNNLQWIGGTYYHKFNDQWHISIESYSEHQNNVANVNNPIASAAIANGGTPFSLQYMPFNGPFGAQCETPTTLTCTASFNTFLTYLNYKPGPLDNISYRAEFVDDTAGQRTGIRTRYFETGLGWQHWFSPQIELRPEVSYYKATPLDNISWRGELYDDKQGQRTGTKTRYVETGLGWQHWFSPQIEIRPEFTYYRSLDGFAFNGNSNLGIPANKNFALIGSADIIIHF